MPSRNWLLLRKEDWKSSTRLQNWRFSFCFCRRWVRIVCYDFVGIEVTFRYLSYQLSATASRFLQSGNLEYEVLIRIHRSGAEERQIELNI